MSEVAIKSEDDSLIMDDLKKASEDSWNGTADVDIKVEDLNGSNIKVNIDEYMGDIDEHATTTASFDWDDDAFADVKLEDYPHNLYLVLKGFDKDFVKDQNKVKEELTKLFSEIIKVELPSFYSPEGKNNYVYIKAQSPEDKKTILTALGEPTDFLTYKIQAKPCLTNNFAYVLVDDSNKDEALDLILKYRNMSYKDQLAHKFGEARLLLKATLDKFHDEIKTRVEKLERKYQPPHANVEKTVPLVPTQHYARECEIRIETNPENNEIVYGVVVADKNLSTNYFIPLKYCIHLATPLIEAVELFVSFLKTCTCLKAYNRATGEGDVIGLKIAMNRLCELLMTVELVRKSELGYGFVPLDPKQAELAKEMALFGKKAKLARLAAMGGKRLRYRNRKPGFGGKPFGGSPGPGAKPVGTNAGEAQPVEADDLVPAKVEATADANEAPPAAPQPAADEEVVVKTEPEENIDESGSSIKEELKPTQFIHLRAEEEDSVDFEITQLERKALTSQVENIRPDLKQFVNQYSRSHGILGIFLSWVKVLGSHHFESAPFLHQIFKRGVLKDDYNGQSYDFNPVKCWFPRIVNFESLMRAVEDVVNFAKHPPENLALCTDYRYLMFYFAKISKQLMVFHRWKCAEGRESFRPLWFAKSGLRTAAMQGVCFAQNAHGQMKEVNKLLTARGIPGTLITWGDMNLGIFARLVELGCRQVVMVFPKSNVFGTLGRYVKLAYPYLRLTRVITLDCQPQGELFSFIAVFQQATGAPPLKKIPGVKPGVAITPMPMGVRRPPLGPPKPLVSDQGGPPRKFVRRDFPVGRPPMEGPPRGVGNFCRDRYIDDRPSYCGPLRNDPWMENRGPSYPNERFDRGSGGPPPASYGPVDRPLPPASMGPPAPDPNITSALNTLSVFMQSQLEFNKMLRTNIEKMSTTGTSPGSLPSLASTGAPVSYPEPVAPPAASMSRPRRDSPPPPLLPAKRQWAARDEPERDTKRPFYSSGGRDYFDDGPSSGPTEMFGSSNRRTSGGSRPSTSDRGNRNARGSDSWDADSSMNKNWSTGVSALSNSGSRYGEPTSSIWGSRDEPTTSYTREVRVKEEEPSPSRTPRGGGFNSEPRPSFGSLAAQRPVYSTPTSNWGSSNMRDRDSISSGGLNLSRGSTAGSGGIADRFGGSNDRFGSGSNERFGSTSTERFASSNDRYNSGGNMSGDRYGGNSSGHDSGRFGGSGSNDDHRFGGRNSWSSGGGSSGGRGFGNSGEARSTWSSGYNNSSSTYYK